MRWSEQEINFLIKTYPSNTAIREIADKLNKSRRAILHKAARIGLSRIKVPINKPKDPEYRRKVDKKYYRKNREKIYRGKMKRRQKIKENLVDRLGGKCKMWGYKKCISALEFHHKDSGKEFSVSELINNSSEQNVLKEANKCILLCANCHREIHAKGVW